MSSRRWKGPKADRSVNKAFVDDPEGREANRKKMRDWWQANADDQRKKARVRIARKRLRNQQWMVNYLHGAECTDCTENDPRCLTFDHCVGDVGKFANVSDLISRGATIERIAEEVAKCEVVCHNCHMLRTFDAIGGSYHDRLRPISDEEFKREYG